MELERRSDLSEATERAVHDTIGAAIEVHLRLGPGLLEAIYADAMGIELDHQGIRFQREYEIPIRYREFQLRSHRADLVVDGVVLVELKAVDRLLPIFQAQVISYLKASGLRIGLLINFNSHLLKEGIRRIIV